MWFVSLKTKTVKGAKKHLIVIRDPKDVEHTFGHNDYKALGDYFVKIGGRPEPMMFSSSCDFPKDEGFPARYDTNKVFKKAIEYAHEKLSISVPVGKLTKATAERIQKLVKGRRFPLNLRFPKTDRTGSDVLLPFNSEDEITQFCNGIRYAKRLIEMTEG